MEKIKLALCVPLSDDELKEIDRYCDITFAGYLKTGSYDIPVDEVYKQCSGNEIIVTKTELATPDTINKWADEGLKFLINARGTPTMADWQTLHDRDIPLGYCPGRNAVAVVEFTIGLIIMLIKKINQAVIGMHDGLYLGKRKDDVFDYTEKKDVNWPRDEGSPFMEIGLGKELYGKTIGIVGYGAIGRKISKICQAFNMNVMAYDPYYPKEKMEEEGICYASVEELLSASDIVSVHLPVTDETRGMINEEWFDMMKQGALFINTARAAVVNQRALVNALEGDKIAGAALDVFWEEPIPENHPLLKMKNVITTPHMAAQTEEIDNVWTNKMITEHILRYVKGEPMENIWKRLK